ncbi:MAG TPA: hypothetical protein GXX20_05875 [Clostridiaceae bacterium]|nr:hypothetical protein [Clostridiaceae bacterium]
MRVSSDLPTDAYRVTGAEDRLILEADRPLGLIAACGQVLRGSKFTKDGMVPTAHRGLTVPDCPSRGVYMANHFHNYYQMASIEEIEHYLEELSLWGLNTMHFFIPEINLPSRDHPDTIRHIERSVEVMKMAKALGWSVSTNVFVNQTFVNFPQDIASTPVPDPLVRHGNSGNIVCLSKPGGQEWMDADNRFYLSKLKELGVTLDAVRAWPYDEGGCGCEQCWPWGSNGYIRGAKRAFEIAREYFPNVKRELSTWTFDMPPVGEWEGLAESLKNEKWCDVILADSHEDFPRWPLEHGVPGGLPMISFPEISMWNLYPWGGYGATLYPFRLERLWKQTQGMLYGASIYSEGITEDLNKVAIAAFCEDWDNDCADVLRQYARYEIGCEREDDFVRLIRNIESQLTEKSPALADDTYALAKEIDTALPEWGRTGWRWRLIYLRALLDVSRVRDEDLNNSEICRKAMEEIVEICHCLKEDAHQDPYHERVCPPLKITE